jgi:hypothetical protein
MKKTDIRERLKTQQMVLEMQDQMNKLLIENNTSNPHKNQTNSENLDSKIQETVSVEIDKIMAIYEETFLGKIE